ncbi:MAG: DUF192 domain-containing protein [Rhodobacteraceae bacterium]|nr:DUF192 domain-containing protein [Paracoccaceae bacterium]
MFHVCVAATLAVVLMAGTAWAECQPDRVELRGDWGGATFRVTVADDPTEHARGLMFVEEMPVDDGMIFIFRAPRRASFWMENTLIPLDMLFVDETGTVRHIHENATPMDRTPIMGGDSILAVLEINGGLSEKFGIDVGTRLRHPGLPQNLAAWPCNAR